MLISRFRKCSAIVKLTLFKSFCMSVYDVALWKYYSVTVFNKFRSGYNKWIKKLFGYHRTDSMSSILINLCLPTADTIVHNSRILFHQSCNASCNKIVQWFAKVCFNLLDVSFSPFFFILWTIIWNKRDVGLYVCVAYISDVGICIM